ncbi:hypothetical protein ENC19_11425 [Verrucosispora sp. CWR15]|uniref:DUF4386 family protein n=1 Tax=Verrucosispora sioxanthis TaxID=2499994 RepID=A0A6M1L4K5_9ACTN|nr:hypothetical protein [Verrucosispora sioxanthis]NEE64120.1 hypothetical protein [Verrucosispora sioxanthis]NGM13230.1 hypothetical protein [Verrucosispora sioxanthis]
MRRAHQIDPARLTGALLLTSLLTMVAGAAVAVPSGLTLNPAEPAATLSAVHARAGLHLTELALDVVGWLALTGAALSALAAIVRTGQHLAVLPAGLLAAAGLAGLLHDAGNLAVTQLSADRTDPSVVAVAGAILLTAKWTVNLAGLLWVAATATAVVCVPMPAGLRRVGAFAAMVGLAAVMLPWTTGVAGPSATLEQFGYLLHLPLMIWYGTLGWRLRNGGWSGHGRPGCPARAKA